MTRYIVLLRGVNVGGITVRSADLARAVTDAGFLEARTVLASGNVLLTSPLPPDSVKSTVEAALRAAFDYDAWVVVRTKAQLHDVVAACPYRGDSDTHHAYVVFGSNPEQLQELYAQAQTAAVDADFPADEALSPGDGVIYWWCPRGASLDTPVAKTTARRAFRETTTTRNLRTLTRLLT